MMKFQVSSYLHRIQWGFPAELSLMGQISVIYIILIHGFVTIYTILPLSQQRIHLLLIFIFRVFVSQSGCGLSKYQDNKIVGGERIKPNQYPWLCSLKTDRGSHICGVTLLGIHPHVKETILVGAAHCYNEGNLNLLNYCLNYYLPTIYLRLTFFFSLKY